MNAPWIFNLVRELTHTHVDDYPDSRLLVFLNAVKDDFWSYIITSIKSKYNWDIWRIDNTVIDQSEYVIPAAATDSEGNLKINTVSICYEWEAYDDGRLKYVKATEESINNLPEHWSYYVNNQPKECPIYYTADKSIFIAPTFEKEIPDGIEIQGIKSIPDYTPTSSEADIKIPSYLHIDLVQGVLPLVHKSEWRKDDASFEEEIYMRKKKDAAQKIANRSTGPSFMNYPTSSSGTHTDSYSLNLD